MQTLQQNLLYMLSGGTNSLIAIAVGTAEGTRSPDGRFTAAYYGHTDPGNGARNQGSFSYQGQANSPQEADVKQIEKFKTVLLSAYLKALGDRTDINLKTHRQLWAIACDCFTQSEVATIGEKGFLELAKEGFEERFVQLYQEIRRWRYLSYFDPVTGRLDAPGFNNELPRLRRDQERRTEAVLRAI
jgi:hypothetical protein